MAKARTDLENPLANSNTPPPPTNAAAKARTDLENPSEFEDWSLRHATTIKASFVGYAILNVIAGIILVWVPQLTLKKIQTIVFSIGVLDALLMGTLTLLYKGFDSNLYWVFFVLIVHNALAIPVALPQILLNLLVSAAFLAGGLLRSMDYRPY